MTSDASTRSAQDVDPDGTLCPHCGQRTPTIGGLCPNCGELKDPSKAPISSPSPRGDFWGDLDDLVKWGLMTAPLATLIILGLIFYLPELLIVAGVLIVVAAVLTNLLDMW